MDALGGNSPILVCADTGELVQFSTAKPLDESVHAFEVERGLAKR